MLLVEPWPPNLETLYDEEAMSLNCWLDGKIFFFSDVSYKSFSRTWCELNPTDFKESVSSYSFIKLIFPTIYLKLPSLSSEVLKFTAV